MKTTLRTKNINGMMVSVPNVVDTTPVGYYVSYNNYDTHLYGSDTTAIVIDRSGAFLILNGDHRDALKGMSLDAACKYFHDNHDLKNKRSNDHQDDVLKCVDGTWKMVRVDFSEKSS